MTVRILKIKNITANMINDLIYILNTDSELAKSLCNNTNTISHSEFIKFNNDWIEKNDAVMFSILVDDRAIGIISLSKINHDEGSANIGYWIGSKYWNKGYTTEAFMQVLEYARNKQIKTVSSSIEKDNTASLSIWKKFNASMEDQGDKLMTILRLDDAI